MSRAIAKFEGEQSLEQAKDKIEMGILKASDPAALVQGASAVATELAQVIDNRNLFSMIKGKKYVKCEGWTTLAAMMGVTPREIESRELEDGSFEATIELARINDGAVISRASAICGMDESSWKNREKYARKSMAATRATGKACRLAFSWVMALAGYEVTPYEEMPQDTRESRRPANNPPTTTTVQPEKEKPKWVRELEELADKAKGLELDKVHDGIRSYLEKGISKSDAETLARHALDRITKAQKEAAASREQPSEQPDIDSDEIPSPGVGEATVDEIKAMVRSGELTPGEALEMEQVGKQRSTLMNWLENKMAEAELDLDDPIQDNEQQHPEFWGE